MPASATDLRSRIAVLLQASYKDSELDGICESFGMPPMTEPPAYNSKRVAIQQRLARVALPEMLEIARRVYDELHDEALGRMIGAAAGVRGVDGELKNLIFAAVGPKPRIVLRDAINNTIEIADGADRCLVYDRALTLRGSPAASSSTGGQRRQARPTGPPRSSACATASLNRSAASPNEPSPRDTEGSRPAAKTRRTWPR